MKFCLLVSGNYFDKFVDMNHIPQGRNWIKTTPPSNIPQGKFARWFNGWIISDVKPDLSGRDVYTTKMNKRQFMALFTKQELRKIKNKNNGNGGQNQDDDLMRCWDILTATDFIDFNEKENRACIDQFETSGVFDAARAKEFNRGFAFKRVL